MVKNSRRKGLTPGKTNRKKKSQEDKITAMGMALRAMGAQGGQALGTYFGQPGIGQVAGTSLGAAFSKWLGYGQYKISRNSFLDKGSNGIAMMHSYGQSIVVRHREYIGDVVSGSGTAPTPFSIQYALALNPGLESSFPWLSTIAQQFQEYTWRDLIFQYIPTSGDSTSGTPSLGTVMAATNYRATDPAYTNKIQMLNEYFASDSVPTDCFVHPIECDPAENPYNVQYIRTGNVPSGEDQKTYDIGVMRLATQGCPVSNSVLGELWCTYEVELKKPKPYGLDSTDSGTAHISFAAATTSNPLGTTRSSLNDTIGLTTNGTTITFPRGTYGTYLINFWWNGATAFATPSLAYSNCSAFSLNLNLNANAYISYTAVTALAGGPTFTTAITITNTSLPATISLGSSNIAGSPPGDILINQISSNYA